MRDKYKAQVESIFLMMLAEGKPVAIEDAAVKVEKPEGVDRRCHGSIVTRLKRAGIIVEVSFRPSRVKRAHQTPKRLWVLAAAVEGGAR